VKYVDCIGDARHRRAAHEDALVRELAQLDPSFDVRLRALSMVAFNPKREDAVLLGRTLAGDSSVGNPPAKPTEHERLVAACGLTLLCARRQLTDTERDAMLANFEALGRAAGADSLLRNLVLLVPWAKASERAVRHLAALQFSLVLLQRTPHEYFAWRGEYLRRLEADLRRAKVPTGLDRVQFLRSQDVPLLMDPRYDNEFTGFAITLNGQSDTDVLHEATHAQELSDWPRPGSIKAMNDVDCPDEATWLDLFAAQEADATATDLIVRREAGLLDLDQRLGHPVFERARLAYRDGGEDALRAQLKEDILLGQLELIPGRPYRDIYREWWANLEVVRRFERLRRGPVALR
jgi:hypothetical protein